MRKVLPLLLIALFSASFSFSQNASANFGKFGLGINIGGAYQQGDIRPVQSEDSTGLKSGIGFGFTADYWLIKNQTSFFGLGLRARYLHTKTRGLQVNPFYEMSSHNSLNGTNDFFIDYTGQSFMYNNYEMSYNEGSLELLLSANRLRAKTGILLYGWGGIGIYNSLTKTNLTDEFGLIYDYSIIDSTASNAEIAKQVASLLDNTYESNATGNTNGIVNWDPTFGIGIGYDFGPASITLEHKVSFLGHDYADGITGQNNFIFANNNDVHHYTNFGLIFQIGGHQETEFTYSDPLENKPVENNLTNDNSPKNPPVVDIIKPSTNPYSTNNSSLTVTGKVFNISGKSQISVNVNGVNVPFTYNGSNQLVLVPTQLNIGTNEVIISASNELGSDSDKQIIIYTRPENTVQPPIVDITKPNSNPHTQLEHDAVVSAKIRNVKGKEEIFVKVNDQFYSAFEYNAQTQMIFMNLELNPGENTVEVVAMNSAGSDQDNTIIIVDGPKPIVTIVSPSNDPHNTDAVSSPLTAVVKNVNSKNYITVTVNGNITSNFTYSLTTQKLSMNVPLNIGSNIVEITGVNDYGTDNDNHTIIRKRVELQNTDIVEECDNPEVKFLSPATSPFVSQTKKISIRAMVKNVNSKNFITVKVNGAKIPTFGYNTGNKLLTFQAVLKEGMNTIVISAQNDCGQDIKVTKIEYSLPVNTETGSNITNINNGETVTVSNNKPNGSNSTSVNSNVNNNVNNNGGSKPNGNNNTSVNSNINNSTGNTDSNKPNESNSTNINSNVNNTINNNGGNKPNDNNVNSVNSNVNGSTGNNGVKPVPPIVTILNPNPHNTENQNEKIKAKVKNVSGKQQIVFKINGSIKTNYSFNPKTGLLIYTPTLKEGANFVSIKATNKDGSDSKAGKLIYQPCKVPELVLINPSSESSTYNGRNPYLFKCKILNVTNSSGIKLIFNGDEFIHTKFNASTGELTARLPLKHNLNNIIIQASNKCGNIEDLIKVIYRPQNQSGNDENPVITVTSQGGNFPHTTSSNSISIQATIQNVSNKNYLELWINGKKTSNFTYNPSTDVFKITVNNLKMGNNTIRIKAVNDFGIVNETYIVKRSSGTGSQNTGGKG